MARKSGGQPGNQNAAKAKRLSAHLQARIDERKLEGPLMDALLDRALDGEIPAIKEVFDRIDGKSKQQMAVEATIRHRSAKEMSDDELAAIATASSD